MFFIFVISMLMDKMQHTVSGSLYYTVMQDQNDDVEQTMEFTPCHQKSYNVVELYTQHTASHSQWVNVNQTVGQVKTFDAVQAI